jgi:hypothetical protein
VIEAHQLVIRDTAGKVRGQLGCAADGHAHLRLMGPDEKPRLAAGVCAGVPGVWLLDAQGRPRLELSLAEDGERVGLHLMDEAGVTRLVLSHGDLGGTQLQLYDQDGRERLIVGCGPCGTSVVQLYHARGGASVGLHAADGRPGLVALADAAGLARAGLYLAEDGSLVVGRDGDNGTAPPEAAGPCPDAGAKAGGHRGTDPGGTTPSPN